MPPATRNHFHREAETAGVPLRSNRRNAVSVCTVMLMVLATIISIGLSGNVELMRMHGLSAASPRVHAQSEVSRYGCRCPERTGSNAQLFPICASEGRRRHLGIEAGTRQRWAAGGFDWTKDMDAVCSIGLAVASNHNGGRCGACDSMFECALKVESMASAGAAFAEMCDAWHRQLVGSDASPYQGTMAPSLQQQQRQRLVINTTSALLAPIAEDNQCRAEVPFLIGIPDSWAQWTSKAEKLSIDSLAPLLRNVKGLAGVRLRAALSSVAIVHRVTTDAAALCLSSVSEAALAGTVLLHPPSGDSAAGQRRPLRFEHESCRHSTNFRAADDAELFDLFSMPAEWIRSEDQEGRVTAARYAADQCQRVASLTEGLASSSAARAIQHLLAARREDDPPPWSPGRGTAPVVVVFAGSEEGLAFAHGCAHLLPSKDISKLVVVDVSSKSDAEARSVNPCRAPYLNRSDLLPWASEAVKTMMVVCSSAVKCNLAIPRRRASDTAAEAAKLPPLVYVGFVNSDTLHYLVDQGPERALAESIPVHRRGYFFSGPDPGRLPFDGRVKSGVPASKLPCGAILV